MTSRIIACVLLLTSASSVFAELRFEKPVAQLEEVRGAIPVRQSFPFINAGKSPIAILDVKRGCGCLNPHWERRVYEPGERGTLVFEVRAIGQKNGPHTWYAQVRYRNGDQIRETSVCLRATVKNDVAVEPAALAMFVETRLRQEVMLTDLRPAPLVVRKVESTSRAIVVTMANAGAGKIRIVLEAAAEGIAPGRYDETLNIYTSDPAYAHIPVPITLTVSRRTAVLPLPERVELEAGMRTSLVRLRPRGDKPVVVERIDVDDPAVKCTWSAGPGPSATVRIEVPATHRVDTDVRIHLREPAGEMVIVPIKRLD